MLKALVEEIIKHPLAEGREWTWQGLGMLRLYLSKRYRMHIWAPSRAVPYVSTLHTHPWDFTSHVVAGVLTNYIYEYHGEGDTYCEGRIKCGAGGGLVNEPPKTVRLKLAHVQTVRDGNSYGEKAEQIHVSFPSEGTVTIVDRTFKSDADHALVFWRYGTKWVSAEPRPATEEEVVDICRMSWLNWFKE